MAKSKKLVFMTTRLFWPAHSGHYQELYHYCRGLHEYYGYDIYLYSFRDPGQKADGNHPDFIRELRYAVDISLPRKLWNLLAKGLPGRWPLQCALYFSAENRNRLAAYIREVDPDTVLLDMARLATYRQALEGYRGKRILNMEDTLSKRYRRQLDSGKPVGQALGVYGKRLPRWLGGLMARQGLQRLALRMETKRMAAYEAAAAKDFDHILFVSPLETAEYNTLTGADKAVTVTLGVDADYYAQTPPGLVKKPGALSIVGDFHTAANQDSLDVLANEVLPLVKHTVTLDVIGSCPEVLRQRYRSRRDIRFVGRVEDLRPAILSTEVFVAPFPYGTGIKTKLLEAMAMGMPVVTDSVGAEGIGAVNGVHWIVEDSRAAMAAQLDALLDDREGRERMGQAAQRMIGDSYRWEHVLESFGTIGL